MPLRMTTSGSCLIHGMSSMTVSVCLRLNGLCVQCGMVTTQRTLRLEYVLCAEDTVTRMAKFFVYKR